MAFYTFCTILTISIGYFVVQSGYLVLRVHQLFNKGAINNHDQLQDLVRQFQKISETGIESRKNLANSIQGYCDDLERIRQACMASLGGLKEVSSELAQCMKDVREIKEMIDLLSDDCLEAEKGCKGVCSLCNSSKSSEPCDHKECRQLVPQNVL